MLPTVTQATFLALVVVAVGAAAGSAGARLPDKRNCPPTPKRANAAPDPFNGRWAIEGTTPETGRGGQVEIEGGPLVYSVTWFARDGSATVCGRGLPVEGALAVGWVGGAEYCYTGALRLYEIVGEGELQPVDVDRCETRWITEERYGRARRRAGLDGDYSPAGPKSGPPVLRLRRRNGGYEVRRLVDGESPPTAGLRLGRHLVTSWANFHPRNGVTLFNLVDRNKAQLRARSRDAATGRTATPRLSRVDPHKGP